MGTRFELKDIEHLIKDKKLLKELKSSEHLYNNLKTPSMDEGSFSIAKSKKKKEKSSAETKASKELKKEKNKFGSDLEAKFDNFLKVNGFNGFETQYKFHKDRDWKLDFAWIDKKIAVEVDGEFNHARYYQVSKDAEKRNMATANGWQIYIATGEMIKKNPWLLLDILKIKLL